MAKITWLSGFVSRKGETWTVRVECDGRDATSCADLSADSPLVIEEDNGEGLYTPLRETSAKIRYFGAARALPFATGDMTHKVEVTRGGVAVWRGWLKPETRTQDLSPAPCVAEVEAAGSLSVLSGIDWDLGTDGTVTLWDLLWTAAERGGSLIGRMVFPKVYFMPGTSSPADPREWLSSLSAQAAVFDDGGGDPSSWGDAVEAVCKFLHWTLWDTGAEWVFTDADAWGMDYVGYTAKDGTPHACDTEGGDLLPVTGGAAMPYAGDAHKVDTMPPYGRFTVNPPDAGGGGGEEYKPDWSTMPRKGDIYQWINSGDPWGTPVPAGTERTMISYFLCDTTNGGDGDVKFHAYNRVAGVQTEDYSTVWLTTGTDRRAYYELIAGYPLTWHLETDTPQGKQRYLYAIPLLIASAKNTIEDGGKEAWDVYNWDYKQTLRISLGYYSMSGNSAFFWEYNGYRIQTAKWIIAPLAIPHSNIATRDYFLDFRFKAIGRTIDYSLISDNGYEKEPPTKAEMWFSVRIADKWYDPTRMPGLEWVVTNDPPVITTAMSFSSSDNNWTFEFKPNIKRTFADGLDDIQGIPISLEGAPLYGSIEVVMYIPRIESGNHYKGAIVCLDITDVSFAFVRERAMDRDDICIEGEYETDREEDREQGDKSAGCWTVGSGDEYPSIDAVLTSYDKTRATGSSVVTGGGDALTRFYHSVLGSSQPEVMLLTRLGRHYTKVRRAWELVLEDAEVSPAAAWSCGGTSAVCGGWQRDAYAATLTMRLEDL